jgi:hypothetical protein
MGVGNNNNNSSSSIAFTVAVASATSTTACENSIKFSELTIPIHTIFSHGQKVLAEQFYHLPFDFNNFPFFSLSDKKKIRSIITHI